jgi:ABC-type thiamine transport system substrate-binding protein
MYPNQVVGTANQPHLARQLIEFLLSHEKQTIFCGKMSSFKFVIIGKHCLQVVGTANQPHLARQLIEFLMGETDGVPKAGLEKTWVFFKSVSKEKNLYYFKKK